MRRSPRTSPVPGTRFLPLVLLAAVAVALPQARAQTDEVDEEARIADARAYLTTLGPSVSTFEQTGPGGDVRTGWLLIAPPLRARIEYKPPDNAVLVADGNFLVFHDPDAGQTSHIPLESTPLRVLLDGRIDDESRVRILGVREEWGVLGIEFTTLDETGEAFPGSITLAFETDPLRLVAWQVLDVQGRATTVRLDSLVPARLGHPEELFRLSPEMIARGELWQGPWPNRRTRETRGRN